MARASKLTSFCPIGGVPWIIDGDFNQIIHPAEHSPPLINHLSKPMMEFKDCLLSIGVFDLRFRGVFHTWSNKRPSGPITEKLGKLLVNNAWLNAYPNTIASFNAPDFSDHSPCFLDLAYPLPTMGTKPFRFFNYLTKHHSFCDVMESCWFASGPTAKNLQFFYLKLKALKRSLKTLNRDNFSNIQVRVSEATRLLEIT